MQSAPPYTPALVFEISEPGSNVTLLPAKAITAPPERSQIAFKIELPVMSDKSPPVTKMAPPFPPEVELRNE
eukprot:326432-Prymnesium_polylepis.1